MAETAKVLSPQKIVLLPDLKAGCSLADSCEASEFAKFKAQYPSHTVISYVNTSVAVKALSDILCTSSNVKKIADSVPRGAGILFGPDRNLGQYVIDITGRDDIVLWNGACHVHARFSAEDVLDAKAKHPEAKVLVHPECPPDVRALGDFTGSTSAIISYAAKSTEREFIVCTEPGILYELGRVAKGKEFYPLGYSEEGVHYTESQCEYMKLVTLDKILTSLREVTSQVVLEESVRAQAERSIRRMLELS
jgi:quinolinate synthase